MYSFCAMYSLSMSFWSVPEILFQSAPCFSLRHHQIHGPQHRSGRINGHRYSCRFEIDAGEEDLHIFERVDRHAAFAHLTLALRRVGVIAHQRGQIKGDRETAAARRQQILVALVCLLRRGEAGELAHRPQLAAVAGGVDAARVRRLSWLWQAEVLGKVGLGIEAPHRHAGDRREARGASFVDIDAGTCADGALWRLGQSGRECLLRPVAFRLGRVAARGQVGCDRIVHRVLCVCRKGALRHRVLHLSETFSIGDKCGV